MGSGGTRGGGGGGGGGGGVGSGKRRARRATAATMSSGSGEPTRGFRGGVGGGRRNLLQEVVAGVRLGLDGRYGERWEEQRQRQHRRRFACSLYSLDLFPCF